LVTLENRLTFYRTFYAVIGNICDLDRKKVRWYFLSFFNSARLCGDKSVQSPFIF